jgi:hypothetical protein
MRPTRDLPEPDPWPADREGDREARARRSLSAALYFAAGYSSVHRLWIPLALHFTWLKNSPFAHWDPVFVGGLWLAGRLRARGDMDAGSALLAGSLVGWAGIEALWILRGDYPGWLGLSHAISAWPLGILSFLSFFFWRLPDLRTVALGWVGALAAVFACFWLSSSEASRPQESSSQPHPLAVAASKSRIEDCGARSLNLSEDDRRLAPKGRQIWADACGLRPSRLRVSGPNLRLTNRAAHSLNLHLMLQLRDARPRQAWNLVVPPGRSIEAPLPKLLEGQVGMLYSDNVPEAGLSLIWSSAAPHPKGESWLASRLPLGFERVLEAGQ